MFQCAIKVSRINLSNFAALSVPCGFKCTAQITVLTAPAQVTYACSQCGLFFFSFFQPQPPTVSCPLKKKKRF